MSYNVVSVWKRRVKSWEVQTSQSNVLLIVWWQHCGFPLEHVATSVAPVILKHSWSFFHLVAFFCAFFMGFMIYVRSSFDRLVSASVRQSQVPKPITSARKRVQSCSHSSVNRTEFVSARPISCDFNRPHSRHRHCVKPL